MVNLAQITDEFKKSMTELYGERLDKIILYGSYARGDFHSGSDIDLLVVLKDEKLSTATEIKRAGDILWSLWEKSYLNIHFLPMTAQKFYHAKSPLLYWVRKEGKEL